MKLYLAGGQVVEINGVSDVRYNVWENGKWVDTINYVERDRADGIDQPLFKKIKLLRDCRKDELASELIFFYDLTGHLRFITIMGQIIGIEEDII